MFEKIDLEGAELLLWRGWLGEDADTLLTELIETTPWRQEQITLFGKTHLQPRLIAWYGDEGASYRYSGTQLQPTPFSATLAALGKRVEAACQHRFNSALLNYYRDGNDAMGMHSDDEPELGERPVIASLSLGTERALRFKHRHDKALPGKSLPLGHGDLLLMRGATQRNWRHGINRSKRVTQARVNLTFRQVVPPTR